MRPKPGAGAARQHEPNGTVRDANFYALPFASQMIVWATRRRLAALCDDKPDDDVLHVFHMADWAELYTHLLAFVDMVVAACLPGKLALHAVSCPCLAPHEAHLLNALAHLQIGRREEGLLCLCEFMAPAGVRLAIPHVGAIADALGAHGLRFAYVNVPNAAPATDFAGTRGDSHHLH